MLQKNDIDRALETWGELGGLIDPKFVEQWGKIDGQSVIESYNALAQNIATVCKSSAQKSN